MVEIPEDVMEFALGITASAFLQKHEELAKKVASAILAERQRCADIVVKFERDWDSEIPWRQQLAAILATAVDLSRPSS